jgi:branched-chain amino acid transport system substrate-binding protein
MTRGRLIGILILGLALLLSACAPAAAPEEAAPVEAEQEEAQPAEEEEAAPAAAEEEPQACTFKIAMIGPLTGDAAFWGNQIVRGATLAIDQVNEAGGIAAGPYVGCTYEVVGPFDDQGDPAESTNIAQQVTTMDDVMAIIGPVNSSNGFAILPILNEARIPTISGGASNADLTKQGWDNFFRAFLNDGGGAVFMAKFLSQQGYEKVVVAYSANDYGQGIHDNFAAKAEELGIELLSEDAWTPGEDREFAPLITRWQSQEPDAIFIAGEYTEAALITKQARLAGMEQPIFVQGAYGPDFLEIAGEQAEGVVVETLFDPLRGDEVTQTFVSQYEERYDETPAENGSIGYDAMLVLNDAVSRMEGSSREDLIAALAATKDFPAMNYVVTFDETGEMEVPDSAPLVVVQDGQYASFAEAS